MTPARGRNVLGGPLGVCSVDPMTGYYRDGCCTAGEDDLGRHLVCSIMTDEFLAFTKSVGNDLSTPRPEYRFPGLKAGDRWCLCVLRWKEAAAAGKAPKVVLAATHAATLRNVDLDLLRSHAVDTDVTGVRDAD